MPLYMIPMQYDESETEGFVQTWGKVEFLSIISFCKFFIIEFSERSEK